MCILRILFIFIILYLGLMHCAIFLSSFSQLKPFFYKHLDFSFWGLSGSLYLFYLAVCSNRLWILGRRCLASSLFACSSVLGLSLACWRLSCRICHALGCSAMIRGLVSNAVGVGCSLFLVAKCCRTAAVRLRASYHLGIGADPVVLCLHPLPLLPHFVNLRFQSCPPNSS